MGTKTVAEWFEYVEDAMGKLLAEFFEGYTKILHEVSDVDAEAFIGTTIQVILESACAYMIYNDAQKQTDREIAHLAALVACDLCEIERKQFEDFCKVK